MTSWNDIEKHFGDAFCCCCRSVVAKAQSSGGRPLRGSPKPRSQLITVILERGHS
jgi:hypothetical protein